MILWFFNKYSLVFIHSSQLPKTLEKSNGSIFCFDIWSLIFSSWSDFRATEGKQTSCYSQQTPFYHIWVCVNELVFGKHLRMGLTVSHEERIVGFSPTPDFWGGERRWMLSQSLAANDVINHTYGMKPPEKTQEEEPWRASRMEE